MATKSKATKSTTTPAKRKLPPLLLGETEEADIPITRIIADPEYNMRGSLDTKDQKAKVAGLAQSIKAAGGLLERIAVVRKGDGFRLVWGFRRHAALTLLAKDDARFLVAKCIVLTPEQAKKADFYHGLENIGQEPLEPWQRGKWFSSMLAAGNMNSRQLAEALGNVSQSQIQALSDIWNKLSEPLREKWIAGAMVGKGDDARPVDQATWSILASTPVGEQADKWNAFITSGARTLRQPRSKAPSTSGTGEGGTSTSGTGTSGTSTSGTSTGGTGTSGTGNAADSAPVKVPTTQEGWETLRDHYLSTEGAKGARERHGITDGAQSEIIGMFLDYVFPATEL